LGKISEADAPSSACLRCKSSIVFHSTPSAAARHLENPGVLSNRGFCCGSREPCRDAPRRRSSGGLCARLRPPTVPQVFDGAHPECIHAGACTLAHILTSNDCHRPENLWLSVKSLVEIDLSYGGTLLPHREQSRAVTADGAAPLSVLRPPPSGRHWAFLFVRRSWPAPCIRLTRANSCWR
jgi:hypothetical protein